VNAKDLTYEKGFSDGYKKAVEHYEKIIQKLVKCQQLPKYFVVTEKRFNEIKEEMEELK